MSESSEIVEQLTLKVERGKKHILDLEATWDTFFNEGAYTVIPKDELHTRNYYLSSVKDIPNEIPLIVGDAIQNLRSALDHLAHHLMSVAKQSSGPFLHVCFPIAENASKYKALRDKTIVGMRQDAIDAIDAIEPYGGGKGEEFWHLHSLNNIDKHRLLLTILADLRGHSLLPSQREEISKTYLRSHPGGTVPDLKGTLIPPKIRAFPLKADDILLTIPLSEMKENMTFLLGIAFGEPGVVKGKPVIDTLHQMTVLVRHTMFQFDRLGLLV